ncbi:MAG TPA: PAS domain S-box protein, partial [Burkholderiales bacterium]|nr:PAS domain S-box protein [Burkholderiales bacterium]
MNMNADLREPSQQVITLLDCQRRVLERIASGAPLAEVLLTIVKLVEQLAPGLRCAILRTDASGKRLEFAAAPNIPEDFKACMAPFLGIGPDMGNCGRAAFRRRPVYTEDVALDPRWVHCRDVALRNGIRAAWSTPVLSDDNAVLGTFTMLYGEPGLPSDEHVQLIDMAVQMARVAIQSKQDEEKLRASEQKYRLIAEHARDLISLMDPAGRRLYASPSFAALYGKPAGSLEGQFAYDAALPEDRARVENEFRAVVASGLGRRFEFRVVTNGKGVRHLQIENSPILDSTGRTTAVLGVGRDVTEERRTQQVLQERTGLLRSIFESASAGIVITDMEHRLLRVNPAFCRITGYAEGELEGRSGWLLSHEEDRDRCEAAFRDLANGTSPVNVDKRYRRKDGSVVWVHVTATLVRDGSSEARYIVALVEDITQRREAQRALEDSARELQALSRRLVELQESERRHLSRELHDRLGETLTALSVNLSMLKDGVQRDERARARVEDSAALVKSTAAAIENIVAELRPPMLDDHGLAAALDWYGKQFAARAGIAVSVQADEPSTRVAPEVGIAL